MRFQAFHDALRAWAFDLWDVMKTDVRDVRQRPRAPSIGGGDVVGTMPEMPPLLWPERHDHSAFFMPSWKDVMAAWRADPNLAAHLEKLVGPAGMRSLVVQHELGFAFWPTSRLAAFWRSGDDPDDVRDFEFESLYSPIERFFSEEHRDIVVLVPLFGLRTEGKLELEPGVEIDRFTREELQLLVDRGILRNKFGGIMTTDNAGESYRHGLRRTIRVAKIIGDTADTDEGAESQRLITLPGADRVRILRTIGCCLDGDVVPQPFIGRTAGWNPGGFVRGSASPILPYSSWAVEPTKLTPADHDAVKAVWTLLGDSSFEASGSLRIAVDRLAWRGTRSNAIDVLVDVAIASEAFFRSGEPEGRKEPVAGEYASARIRRRASEFIDARDFSMDEADVRQFFGAAYKLRNSVMHRGAHAEQIDDGSGHMLDFLEFVERYVGLLRRAVLKHMLSARVLASPAWESVPGLVTDDKSR